MRRFVVIFLTSLFLFSNAYAQDIVAQILARVPSAPRSYSQVMSKVAELEKSDRVTVTTLGKSAGGRELVALTVQHPQATSTNTRKLFIIARQHGNEPSGTEAALALAEHFATATGALETGTLRYMTFVIIPVANPDGAATGLRRNAAGADLNRDWDTQRQPETRLIASAVRSWRPDALIDLHELPASSSKASYQESFIETIGSAVSIPQTVSAHTLRAVRTLASWLPSYGQRANVYYDGPSHNRALCHRQFGLVWNIPSFLIEAKNGSGRTMQHKASLHILGMLVLANHLIHCEPVTPLVPLPDEAQWAPVDLEEEDHETTPSGPVSVQLVELNKAEIDNEESIQVEAQIANGQSISYVKFYVDGVLRMVSNAQPYCCTIDGGTLGSGEHDVSVEVIGEDGTLVAQTQRQINLNSFSAIGQ